MRSAIDGAIRQTTKVNPPMATVSKAPIVNLIVFVNPVTLPGTSSECRIRSRFRLLFSTHSVRNLPIQEPYARLLKVERTVAARAISLRFGVRNGIVRGDANVGFGLYLQ
jgi:hypothetical protein